ncbi:MAG: aspartyl protease family protein [Deltaproteobacteria bacterium]|nr:aspartyl protease family protein [Deltaproteobacteria bacterium]
MTSSIVDKFGIAHTFRGILDTGAPTTEFSDEFLNTIGLLKSNQKLNIEVSPFEQTKKYGKLTIPKIKCLGQEIENVAVRVAKFAEGWGIDALIGLDFFRLFRVTIDYQSGSVITEPF